MPGSCPPHRASLGRSASIHTRPCEPPACPRAWHPSPAGSRKHLWVRRRVGCGVGCGVSPRGDRGAPLGLGQVPVAPHSMVPLERLCCVSASLFPGADPRMCPPQFLQGLLVPRQRRRADAAGPLSPRRPGRPRHPAARPADQHAEPRGGGVRRHHQQPHPARLHRRQGLREDLGHQPAGQQEPHLPARLPGKGPGVLPRSVPPRPRAAGVARGPPPSC